MPLDSRKVAHINTVVPKTWAQRQRTVTLVYLISGAYSYVAETVIARPRIVNDPELTDLVASAVHNESSVDLIIMAPLSISWVGVVYVADTPTATSTAVAAAQKYEVIEALPVGIVAGGSHTRVLLRRLR